MTKPLVEYLGQRHDASTFLLPMDLEKTLIELFLRPDEFLPQPYKIFPADETQASFLGFPVVDAAIMRELDGKLDRWLTEEIPCQVDRNGNREKCQMAFQAYMSQLVKVAENALMSNLMSDYHAVFWLAHSFDLARHFSSIPRRLTAIDTQSARAMGDSIKYRVFVKWGTETRNQMAQLAARLSSILEGEEQRGLRFLGLLLDDVLILTEEFIGTDLREIRTFITGYLRRDFQAFRNSLERLRTAASDLLRSDRGFRAAMPLFGCTVEGGVTLAMLLSPRVQGYLFDFPEIQEALGREEREQFQSISRRVREFAVLNQLRRAIVWMTALPDGQIVSADRRSAMTFSRSTRPMDFGRSGVVDPVVHRFGMIYDISKFSETLGRVRRAGGKEELRAYRQMLLFQRRMDTIAQRHLLQFEKFLGDGAFYTTRRALRLIRAAVEIQGFYSELRRKGFAYDKGLRIALNFGYYRLLPMRTSPDSSDVITEFYGPGIVELSRLTTGKSTKEIEELAAFLVAKGYSPENVQQFFAPLARGVEVVDPRQQSREFYVYLDGNGHLVNEGIVASMPLLQELSNELAAEGQQLFRVRTEYGPYISFAPSLAGVDLMGVKLVGMVALKGLDNLEVGELLPFPQGEPLEIEPIEPTENLVGLLRHDLHQQQEESGVGWAPLDLDTSGDRAVDLQLVICLLRIPPHESADDDVLIGQWDPRSDDVMQPLRLPRGDFQRLFSLKGEISEELLARSKHTVREMYERLAHNAPSPALPLGLFRDPMLYDAYLLGDVVEKL
jgi:hypothetical protein